MKLAIYSKAANNEVVFYGVKEWPSVADFLKACYPAGDAPNVLLAKLPAGFPDTSAYWSGKWAYSPQAERPKMRSICLTDSDVAAAKALGGGNTSKGVRLALEVIGKLDDLSPYL